MISDPPSRQSCTYCGLPLPRSWRQVAAENDTAEPVYCCVGCRIASAVTNAEGAEGEARWMVARLGFGIFFTMNVMVFAMALWSHDFYDQQADAFADSLAGLFRYLALLFSLPVLFLLGGPILSTAWQSLRRGNLTTDVLIIAGVAAAYLYSAVSVIRGQGHIYFEVGCMVLVLVTLGRWLEASGKLKTNHALDALARLLPDELRLISADTTKIVPRSEVRRGDCIRVLPGERFAVDGTIVAGQGDVDQQLLSGESLPVGKRVGDPIFSGTLNLDGDLTVEVTAAEGQETVSRFVRLVKEARQQQGRYQKLADRIAALFIPATWLTAIGAFAYHWTWFDLESGILAGLSVVLIACPCALGLATPMAVWAAMGRAAAGQVLFRSGAALERLAGVQAVRLDKTGTLTSGVAVVDSIRYDVDSDPEMVRSHAVSLAGASNHPLSLAVAQELADEVPPRPLTDAKHVSGRGLSASVGCSGPLAYLGSPAWMIDSQQAISGPLSGHLDEAVRRGRSVACIGWEGRVRGVISFGEHLRPQSRMALERCRDLGLDVAVLTGDHQIRADQISAELGVAVRAEQLPADKVAALADARDRFGPTAMVGDGINDAPGLAASDVGIAMGCGADLTRDSADVCLLSDDLLRLPWTIALARRTVHIVRQNLFWAFAYNTVGIGLAACGKLNPILSALAMAISSLLVVANSMRLSRFEELVTRSSDSCAVTGKRSFATNPVTVASPQGESVLETMKS